MPNRPPPKQKGGFLHGVEHALGSVIDYVSNYDPLSKDLPRRPQPRSAAQLRRRRKAITSGLYRGPH